jgi:hypothetical protein
VPFLRNFDKKVFYATSFRVAHQRLHIKARQNYFCISFWSSVGTLFISKPASEPLRFCCEYDKRSKSIKNIGTKFRSQ